MKEHRFPDQPPIRTSVDVIDDVPTIDLTDARGVGRTAIDSSIAVASDMVSETEEAAVANFNAAVEVNEDSQNFLEVITDNAGVVSPELKALSDTRTISTTKVSPLDLSEAENAAVEAMEKVGFAKVPPTFAEQLKDERRREPFKVFAQAKVRTEHEGLVNLDAFLGGFLESCAVEEMPARIRLGDLEVQARSMRENLTFIGSPEYSEALIGIGNLWKSYLEADPERQIAVLTKIGSLPRFLRKAFKKSDEYLWEQIFDTFTDEEKELFGPRIVPEVDQLTADPEKVRVVILDDWTISGEQMRDVHELLDNDPVARPYLDADCLEINVLCAAEARIKDGLELDPYDEAAGSIPVKAYFKAHPAPAAVTSGFAHITGLHSAVNHGFYKVCQSIQQAVKEVMGVDLKEPLLAQLYAPYKKELIGDRVLMGALRNLINPIIRPRRRNNES